MSLDPQGGDQLGRPRATPDLEGRVRRLEELYGEMHAEQRAMSSDIKRFRAEMVGDLSRQDPAGRGALALIYEAITQQSRDLIARMDRSSQTITAQFGAQTNELRNDLEHQLKGIADKVEKREEAHKRFSDRTWNALMVGSAAILAFGSYVIVHFLPSAPVIHP